jgi:serine protease
MKFCTLVLANLLASAAYAKECKYCNVSTDSLPLEMINTLKEIASQQASQEIFESSNVFFEPDDDQDAKDIARQIGATLSAFDISSKILPTDDTDEYFIITLPKVSLESLTYGVFELPNHLKKGFGLLAAEPDFYTPISQENDIKPFSSGSGGGDGDNLCFDEANKEWHLRALNVPRAWQYSESQGKSSKGEGIIIGQMDTGYSDHKCFKEGGFFEDPSNKGFNVFQGENPNDPKDTMIITDNTHSLIMDPGHGTLLGTAAVSSGDVKMETEDQSATPLAPKGTAPSAKLLTIRTVNSPALTNHDVDRLARAYHKIVDENIDVHVITMSLGHYDMEGSRRDKLSQAMCRAQNEKDLITIAAGGQTTSWAPITEVMFPARFDHVIAIGGYEARSGSGPLENRQREYYKVGHYGSGIDATGPAKNVCSSQVKEVKDGNPVYDYNDGEGTSYATALTGGVAALWLAHHGRQELIDFFAPYTLNQAFQMALRMSAHKSNWYNSANWWQASNWYDVKNYGGGMIDAEKILQTALSTIKNKLKDSGAKTGYNVCKTEDVRSMLSGYGLQETALASFSDEELEDHFLELSIYAQTNQAIAAQTDSSSQISQMGTARTIVREGTPALKPVTLSSALRPRLESSTVNKTKGDEL